MRAVAAELDVAPNTLYSHVAGKDALLDALIEDLLGRISTSRTGNAADDLQKLFIGTVRVMLADPDLASVYTSRPGRGPEAARLAAHALELLRDLHVGPERSIEVFRVLIAYTVGYASFRATRPSTDLPADSDAYAEPIVRANLTGLTHTASDQEFARGLTWLLAGALQGATL